MLNALMERRAALKAALEALHKAAVDDQGEARSFTEAENTEFDTKVAEIRSLDERITELQEAEKREAAAAAHRVEIGEAGSEQRGVTTVKEPAVYAKGNYQRSYFRDLAKANLSNDAEARERLNRHAAQMADEQRALGNTNTTGGSGGEFAPPTWLVNDYIKLARAGRVTADLFKKSEVPAGTSSINIPRIATGTTVAIQSTQNTALSQTDLTTASVSTGFTTVGGKQVVSQQLLDQSAINFDDVILQDLAAAYAQQIGSQVIVGAGTGANNNSVINGLANASVLAANQATLAASPTPTTFYSKANGMLASFVTNRYANPTHWIMHPRRWYWLMAQVDSQGRPLVVPTAVAMNPIASDNPGPDVQGVAGNFLGLPVVIDPNLPVNLGAGTNQDEIFLVKADDLWLFESQPKAEVFREPYADSVGVLFRLYSYAGTILNRYNSSIATMNGAGLVTPTF
ncbi:MAG: phage major capsid protein [Mycobacteriaceae bacterium]